MKEILKDLGILGVKVLMFLAGFCACFAMFTGALVVLTQMTFLNSILTSIAPSILFGIWCQSTVERDLKEP